PLASLLSPSGLYCDAVPPDIPLDLAAALAERYELREVLGRGGMATVYLAYDRKHRRDVALKVLLPGLAAFLGVERFLKEIQVAARLTHPHILALHDSGEAGGFLYYVMPYIEGGSLRQQLAGRRPRGADQALAIAAPVADALSYAHRMGVLPRDTKPGHASRGRWCGVLRSGTTSARPRRPHSSTSSAARRSPGAGTRAARFRRSCSGPPSSRRRRRPRVEP